jgi:hypothetical protein
VAILAAAAGLATRSREQQRRTTMTKDLGVWTAQDCAQVLIDYQNEKFEAIRSETPANLVELHVRLLAKTAKAHGMPIVLSTVDVKFGFNGPMRAASAHGGH